MERTVQKLATYNTKWLQIFFNSNDISLEVSFDEKERLHRHFKWASHTGVLSGGQWRRAQLGIIHGMERPRYIPIPITDYGRSLYFYGRRRNSRCPAGFFAIGAMKTKHARVFL